MNIESLKNELSPWLEVDTWHTSHPLDEQRFHQALKSTFDTLGASITFDNFKEAMLQLAIEHHPTMLPSQRDETIEKFAQKAVIIANYLLDISTSGLFDHHHDF